MNRFSGSDSNQGDSQADNQHLDNLLTALNHRTRREAIHYFASRSEWESSVQDIADHIVQVRASTNESPNRREIIIELHHLHLPKLAETGIIEFDPGSWRVRYLGDDTVESLLEGLENLE